MSGIESYTPLTPSTARGSVITLGPYKAIAPHTASSFPLSLSISLSLTLSLTLSLSLTLLVYTLSHSLSYSRFPSFLLPLSNLFFFFLFYLSRSFFPLPPFQVRPHVLSPSPFSLSSPFSHLSSQLHLPTSSLLFSPPLLIYSLLILYLFLIFLLRPLFLLLFHSFPLFYSCLLSFPRLSFPFPSPSLLLIFSFLFSSLFFPYVIFSHR